MVATVVRLRLRILGHILRRERWRLVVLVAGVVWVVAMLPSILGAQVWLSQQSVDVAGDVLVIAGSLLVTGWAVVPMLLPTLDDSLEPARFATFAVPVRRLTPALLVAAMVGVPTAFTALLVTSPALGWAAHGPAPALVALAAAPVALVTCLLAARLSTGLFGLLLAAPRAREIGAALVLVGLAVGVPAVRAISGLGLEGVLETVPTVARVLGWTPLGLVWAAPAAMADGDALGALGRLVAGSGAALLGLVAWTALLKRSLVRPAPRGGRERRRADVMLPGPARPGRAPDRTAVVTRAVARRAWRYWTADPRYQSAMLAAVLAPVVMVLLVATVVHAPAAVALSMGPFMAATIGWGRHNDVAMDGSAFWMHVVAAVPGRADRGGRAIGTLAWALPVTVVVSVLGAAVAGRLDLTAASVGAAVGLLCVGLAVSAVFSPLLPYPVPAAGSSPFTAETGSVGASMLAQVVTSAATLALGLPVVVAYGLALWWRPQMAVVTLVIGLVGGAAVLGAGVRLGGRAYDARASALVARLR